MIKKYSDIRTEVLKEDGTVVWRVDVITCSDEGEYAVLIDNYTWNYYVYTGIDYEEAQCLKVIISGVLDFLVNGS